MKDVTELKGNIMARRPGDIVAFVFNVLEYLLFASEDK